MTRRAKQMGMAVAACAVATLAWVVHFHTLAVSSHVPKWGWLQGGLARLGEAPPPAEADEDPDNTKNVIPVHAGEVTVATLHRYLEGFGVVMPRPQRGGEPGASASLSGAGTVTDIPKRVGDAVHSGDVVARLDDRVARAAEQSAEAALAQTRASLAATTAQPRPEQLAVAELGVQKAAAALDFAQKNLERTERLAAGDAVSAKNARQAANDVAGAKNDLAVAERQLAGIKALPTPEDLSQERAKVAQATAALASARLQREMLTLTSPIDGVVVAIGANVGESADPTKPVVQIIDPQRLCIAMTLAAEAVPMSALGLEVQVLREGVEPVSTKVSFVSPQVDARTGTVQLTADLPQGTVRAGETARVRVVVETHGDCLVVPRAAVVADENGDPVLSVLEGEQATHKSVKVGLEEGGLIEVSADGLAAGMRVVTQGASGLPQATHVRVVP